MQDCTMQDSQGLVWGDEVVVCLIQPQHELAAASKSLTFIQSFIPLSTEHKTQGVKPAKS
jgi:hypothetical protein